MKTQHIHSASQNTQSKLHGGRNMNSSLFLKNKQMPENSIHEDNIQSVASKEIEQVTQHNKHSVLFDVISTILVIFVGLTVYKTSGLYNGIDSITGKIALGALISFLYVAVFRHAIYAR